MAVLQLLCPKGRHYFRRAGDTWRCTRCPHTHPFGRAAA